MAFSALAAMAISACLEPLVAQQAPEIDSNQWQSEVLSDQISVQLQKIGDWMRSGCDGECEAISPRGRNRIANLRPATRVLFKDSSHEVRRAPAAQAHAGNSLSEFATLAGLFESIDRIKFKVILVKEVATLDEVISRQLVTFSGLTKTGRLEINATWEALWAIEGEQDLMLTALAPIEHEEVTAESMAPQFSDSTLAVIGNTQAWRQQLRFGNDHWRQRIELFNRFFKFGHHGLAVGDANGDGLDDVYVCQNGGLPNRLFVADANGAATDVSHEAGVDFLDLTRSALFVDLDNDGDQDLVLAADTGLLALRNNGRGQFEVKLRYPQVRNAFSVSAADYDNDGDVDLFVCRYHANREEGAKLAIPMPYFNANNGGGNFLIRNDGMSEDPEHRWLEFSDATKDTGLDGMNNRRFSLASVWEDLDDDGDQDLFVANDFGLKNLYLNEGGKFRDIAIDAGVDDGGFGMSAASGDFNRDGIPDLYAGNMFSSAGSRVTAQNQFRPELQQAIRARFRRMARGNSLFAGVRSRSGSPRFEDVSLTARVAVGRWSWASLFADLNNDGWEDLVVANGYVTGRVPDDL